METSCSKHGNVPAYFVGKIRKRLLCKQCNVERVTNRRREIKRMAVEYKGGCCSICGYNKCVAALQFHHIDPTLKDFAIGSDGETRSWERTRIELDKCILVCANCHAEIHAISR